MKYFEDLVNFKILNEQVPGRKGQTSPEKKQENLPPAQAEVDSYLRDQGIDPNSTTSGFRPFDDFGVKPTPTSSPASTPSEKPPSSIFGTNPTMSAAMMKSAMKRDRELLARFQRVAERQAEEGTVDKNLQNRINDLQGKIGNPFDPSVPDQLIDYQNRQKQIEMQYGTEATNKIKEAEATKKKLQDLEKRGVGKFVGGGRQLFSSGPSFKTAAEEDAYTKAKAAFDFMTTSATEYRGGFGGTRYNPSLRTPEDQKEMEKLFDISRKASDEVDRERKNASKISGMYNVTHGDFQNAFGHPYDAMNKDDQRLFFDLNSRLKAGEKIRPFDKPASPDEGRFERIPEPTLPRQVSTSGAKPLEMPSPTSMGFDREVTSQIPRRAVAAQQPTAQEPRFEYDGDMQRRAKTVIPARTRRKEVTRGVGAPINQGINALVAAAQTAGQKLNDYLKVNLAQTMPTTMATKLYGEPETANVPFDNVQRGQFPIDMYYDPEQRTGILDPSIVSRTTMPSYDTRTGEFIVEPRRAFQRNSPLPINVQQFMNRLYRMSR